MQVSREDQHESYDCKMKLLLFQHQTLFFFSQDAGDFWGVCAEQGGWFTHTSAGSQWTSTSGLWLVSVRRASTCGAHRGQTLTEGTGAGSGAWHTRAAQCADNTGTELRQGRGHTLVLARDSLQLSTETDDMSYSMVRRSITRVCPRAAPLCGLPAR